MFGLEEDDASRREKCYTTISQLPQFIDPKQPPIKKPPFSAILSNHFVHTVEVTMPKQVYLSIESSLDSNLQKLRYARLSMTLSSLIEGDFFNTYIKTGNILMISEGRSGLDNVFTLKEGVLKLELGKEDYEKTGLTGKPVRTGGKKHGKERFVIELNLRLPSMLHGKKGFQRVEWAFKNVLNKPTTWLFFDLGTESTGVAEGKPGDPTLKGNNPELISCEPVLTTYDKVVTPSFSELHATTQSEPDLRDICGEVSEWLAMVSLRSRRVSATDNIDPYLCRYVAPEISHKVATAIDLISLKWGGLIPSHWIMQLFITLFRKNAPRLCKTPAWFALSANTLGRDAIESKDGYTIMALPASGGNTVEKDEDAEAKNTRHFICWEYVGASIL
ncbi:ribonuclease P protein subunit p40 [Aspergillus foveolatus]|uniref:ribonuclease P protein subunit p40 n=1 Tax=Aspergillus foveolatus TaxID=210207 RepID=UPI003CCE44E3